MGKYRVRNRKTRSFVSKPTSYWEADKWKNKLNKASLEPNTYEIVDLQEELKKLSSDLRPMTTDERDAIKHLDKIKYNPGANHGEFASVLLEKIIKGENEITDRQATYLWHIVYHYRRQLSDERIIQVAKKNKIY